MTCDNCFNNSCGCDPCSHPAKYGCDFDIQANPYDASIWNVTINGATKRVKIPKIAETDTKLSTSYSAAALTYNAEKHVDTITGAQLGGLINVEDLRDTETANADSCDLLVYNPHCSECGDGCKPKNARWKNYHIPDAGDCEVELGDDGYYRVLVKDDCGCIRECRLPVSASGMISINYVRDSVPDDPDFPWYYGCYNDRINLYLAQNASAYFGKYDLEVTVNYGIQVVKSTTTPGYNFRSLLVPVIADGTVDVSKEASTLQGNATYSSNPQIPWGSQSLRGSFTFIVPRGKEAYLHHEFRIRTNTSFPNYAYNATYDGKKVPTSEATQIDHMLWAGSRLNALQVIVRPTRGSSNYNPAVDTERAQLDDPVDAYPNIG
jgi:hypothetical protein